MGKILIACNNDSTTILHDFLEHVRTEAKQICADNSIEYSPVYPPNLSEQNVIVSCLNTNFVFLPVMVIQMEFIMRPRSCSLNTYNQL